MAGMAQQPDSFCAIAISGGMMVYPSSFFAHVLYHTFAISHIVWIQAEHSRQS